MRVTFNNRLRIEERPYVAPRITYQHARRMELKIFIDYTPRKAISAPPQQEIDWRISLEGDNATISHMREIIVGEIVSYLKQRTQNRFSALNFMDILDLADMRSVN